MHSTPTNIPQFDAGDSIKARTLNHLAEITKSNSTQTSSPGMHAHSTSSGNSISLDINLQSKSIWVQITGVRKKYALGAYPSLSDPDCPDIAGQFEYCFPPFNPATCPNYWYAYSWVELIEDYDLKRHGSEIFRVFPDTKLPTYTQPFNNINHLTSGEPLEIYKRSCRDISAEYQSAGGMFGYINNVPLLEVQNQILPKGFITRAYFGKGNYLLTVSPSTFATYNTKAFPLFSYPDKCQTVDSKIFGYLGDFSKDSVDGYFSSSFVQPEKVTYSSQRPA